MKEKFLDDIKDIISESKAWLQLEFEYAKLTVAEKFTVFMSALIFGSICLMFGFVLLILLSFSLAELFKLMMDPALAYLSTAGCILVLLLIVFLLRKPLLLNPSAKFITRLFIDKKD